MYIQPDDFVKQLIRLTFPSYNGKKFRIKESTSFNSNSMWDGGSRSYFAAVDLATMQSVPLPETRYMDLKEYHARQETPIVPGIVVVKHEIFCGKDIGITFLIHPDNATKFLPAGETQELTADEKLFIELTGRLKNSYGGETNIRFKEAQRSGMTAERWETAKASLIEKKLLMKNGALTLEGKNIAYAKYK